jgi:hypothetical protein
VIENIEHSCKFEGCTERMPLAEAMEHTKICSYRLVTCPAIRCKLKVAFNQVMDHILNTCEWSFAKMRHKCIEVENSKHITIITNTTEIICQHRCQVETLIWGDKFFFLTQNMTNGKFKNVYMQMLGSQKECEAYKISIAMKDKKGQCSLQFSDHPKPIDMDEEEKNEVGLKMTEKEMMKFCKPLEQGKSQYQFTLTFEAVRAS